MVSLLHPFSELTFRVLTSNFPLLEIFEYVLSGTEIGIDVPIRYRNII